MTRVSRKVEIKDGIVYVPLTRGYVAQVDLVDLAIVDGKNWMALVITDKEGNHKKVYAVREKDRKAELMHRVIMSAEDGIEVDHINGNGLINNRINLRIATHAQNMRNSKIPITNTSGIKGVSWEKGKNKWRACISINGKTKRLGTYSKIDDAAEAYAKASKEIYGEFSKTDQTNKKETS